MTSIADKLSALMKLHGRHWMRRRCDIEPAAFNNYITGRKRPAMVTVLKIGRALGIDPIWLADDQFDLPPVRLSAAYSDESGADDTTRARIALHRAIDLLSGDALASVLDFVRTAVKRQSVQVQRGETIGSGYVSGPDRSSLSIPFASGSAARSNSAPSDVETSSDGVLRGDNRVGGTGGSVPHDTALLSRPFEEVCG